MKDVYQEITDRLVHQLEQGIVPWQQPWKTAENSNLISRQPYHGINCLMTGTAQFDSPYWVTFKQATDLKGTIKKGEKSVPIVFWKFIPLKDEGGHAVMDSDGKQKVVPFLRYSNVFNLNQTEGIPSPDIAQKTRFEPLAQAQALVDQANLCPILIEGTKAIYTPTLDFIAMPPPNTFQTSEQYYHTLFHEMGHATGHPSRLNRDLSGSFGSPMYAKEELIAELSSCFLSNQAGTMNNLTFDNSASYIGNWLKTLKGDKTLIIAAASSAQKAADLILGAKEDITQSVTSTEVHRTTQGLRPAAKLLLEARHSQQVRINTGISLS